VHGNQCYVKLASEAAAVTFAVASLLLLSAERRMRLSMRYPQVAQTTVEMLIDEYPQNADFSCRGDLAPPSTTS
jgi:hypothetical protein